LKIHWKSNPKPSTPKSKPNKVHYTSNIKLYIYMHILQHKLCTKNEKKLTLEKHKKKYILQSIIMHFIFRRGWSIWDWIFFHKFHSGRENINLHQFTGFDTWNRSLLDPFFSPVHQDHWTMKSSLFGIFNLPISTSKGIPLIIINSSLLMQCMLVRKNPKNLVGMRDCFINDEVGGIYWGSKSHQLESHRF
jgi:hypothetical protein